MLCNMFIGFEKKKLSTCTENLTDKNINQDTLFHAQDILNSINNNEKKNRTA